MQRALRLIMSFTGLYFNHKLQTNENPVLFWLLCILKQDMTLLAHKIWFMTKGMLENIQ